MAVPHGPIFVPHSRKRRPSSVALDAEQSPIDSVLFRPGATLSSHFAASLELLLFGFSSFQWLRSVSTLSWSWTNPCSRCSIVCNHVLCQCHWGTRPVFYYVDEELLPHPIAQASQLKLDFVTSNANVVLLSKVLSSSLRLLQRFAVLLVLPVSS